MENSWVLMLLDNAKEEIKRLRAENNIMSARLEMFDNIMSIFNAQKQQTGRGMARDIVYDIEKVIEEFNTDSIANRRNEEDRLRQYTKNDFGGKP